VGFVIARARRGKLLAGFAVAFVMGCSPTAGRPRFDGDRAFDLLARQVGFGPRYPGSAGHEKAADFLANEVRKYSQSVVEHRFTRRISGRLVHFRNIIAFFNQKSPERILLCAHWDTRPIADQEIDESKRKQPIPGANDGASGVAVLLELARLFAVAPPRVGVVMVFFDGEDYGEEPTGMFIGSEEFARNWRKLVGSRAFKYGILLDMVGDRNLKIYRESFSNRAARTVVDRVWAAAHDTGNAAYFIDEVKHAVTDDHIPLLEAGIKCIDVIDIDYAPWHTLDDTVDKCSAKSLQVVGDVISEVVYRERGTEK